MPKCPKCHKEVWKLLNYVSGEKKFDLILLEDGDTHYEEVDFYEDSQTNDYECPECLEVLFGSEDEAIKFLKGQDELQQIVAEKIKEDEKEKHKRRNN